MDLNQFEDVGRGLVPWNVDEFMEVVEFYTNLHDTPKDDWDDLKDKQFILEHNDEGESVLRFNAMASMNQLGFYMVKRYPDRVQCPHYLYRFMQIQDFLKERRDQLIEDGFAREGDNGVMEFKEAILTALCVLPYSQLNLEDGKHWGFDYDEVAGHAHMLAEKGSGDEPDNEKRKPR